MAVLTKSVVIRFEYSNTGMARLRRFRQTVKSSMRLRCSIDP